ncbi:vexin-like [Anguilla rostrata]|uniref:vexin-like n=1 Tax=Anguilla rostrata TaxID=7938 RepID=UPI0030D24CC5
MKLIQVLSFLHVEIIGSNKVVVVVNYQPCGLDELELCQGDVIRVLFKDDESRWFGRLQNGQQGYFPVTHVTKFYQKDEPVKLFPSSLQRNSVQAETADVLGGSTELRSQRGGEEGLFLALRPGASLPLMGDPAHGSPSLLRRILSKPRRACECQGATNGAFEPD